MTGYHEKVCVVFVSDIFNRSTHDTLIQREAWYEEPVRMFPSVLWYVIKYIFVYFLFFECHKKSIESYSKNLGPQRKKLYY